MKCLEAAAGRPNGAEQIQGEGRLAVNYAAILPGNLQPGAGPLGHGKPRAEASSLRGGCWEAVPRAAPVHAWSGRAGASAKALPVPGHGEHARSPALSACPGWILTAGWAFHAPAAPFPSFCALLPRGKAARAEGQSGHTGAAVVSAWAVGNQGALNPSASGTGVTGGPAAGGQQK